jgi:hypothetical protein
MTARLEDGLVARLLSDASIAGYVSARIWPDTMPPNAVLPAVTYQRIATTRPAYAHNGPSGYVVARLQIDCWALDRNGANDVGDAVRKNLDGYRGWVGNGDSLVPIGRCFLVMELAGYEPEDQTYRKLLDFEIAYQE